MAMAEATVQLGSEKHQGLILLALIFLAVVGAALWYGRLPRGEPLVVAVASPSISTGAVESRPIRVYVTGGVLRPGVYTMPVGARIEDAVLAAGGLTVDADRAQVNLAAVLKDGQHIHVATFRETLPPSAAGAGSPQAGATPKVNINTASAADLEKLPRIGEVTAGKIIAYRQAHGPFSRIEELVELGLVRPADFQQLEDLICVQ